MKIPLIQLCGIASLICGIGVIKLANRAHRRGYATLHKILTDVALLLAVGGLGVLTFSPIVG